MLLQNFGDRRFPKAEAAGEWQRCSVFETENPFGREASRSNETGPGTFPSGC
jgi:hypothetical protein